MISVILLTASRPATAAKLEVGACPENTHRTFMPDANQPRWAACKDSKGLYQGLIIQFSNQLEILRVASVKDSLRHGKEIRPGNSGFLEEKHYSNGHLQNSSFVFKAELPLGRIMPKPMSASDWKLFSDSSSTSLLQAWLKQEPISSTEFQNGRLTRLKAGTLDYRFSVSPDGRIFALNHPEMKKLFFIDPETLWNLNADDLKKALLPGFGSCKKYDGPIGRFTRNYDHALFKKQATESKQLAQLKTIRDRFIKFCVPEDLLQNLGTIECPPQLPNTRPPRFCVIPVSDQLHIPYEPKYFKHEYSFGRTPEEFVAILNQKGALNFLSTFEKEEGTLDLAPGIRIMVKKSPRGLIYRSLIRDKKGNFVMPDPTKQNEDWFEWSAVPGYSGL